MDGTETTLHRSAPFCLACCVFVVTVMFLGCKRPATVAMKVPFRLIDSPWAYGDKKANKAIAPFFEDASVGDATWENAGRWIRVTQNVHRVQIGWDHNAVIGTLGEPDGVEGMPSNLWQYSVYQHIRPKGADGHTVFVEFDRGSKVAHVYRGAYRYDSKTSPIDPIPCNGTNAFYFDADECHKRWVSILRWREFLSGLSRVRKGDSRESVESKLGPPGRVLHMEGEHVLCYYLGTPSIHSTHTKARAITLDSQWRVLKIEYAIDKIDRCPKE